jgi:radical SAM-linked protein
MASDSSLDARPAAALPSQRFKVRIRFRKGGDLRLVSHHDLMHCFERMLRRAELPVHASQGFHPKASLVFAQSLALGIVGSQEVAELELDEPLPAEEIHHRLSRQAPIGLEILSVSAIHAKAKAHVRRAGYRVAVPPESCTGVPERIVELLAADHAWFERTRPEPRRLDLRPYLSELHLTDGHLVMMLWVTPNGTARPEEILQILGLGDVLEQGAIIERNALELQDETQENTPARC